MTDREKKIAEDVLADYESAKQGKATKRTNALLYYKRYCQIALDSVLEETLHVPKPRNDIEILVSRYCNPFFYAEKPYAVFMPTEESDEAGCEKMNHLAFFRMQAAEFPIKFIDIVKEDLIYGNGFTKTYPVIKKDLRIPKPAGEVEKVLRSIAKMIAPEEESKPIEYEYIIEPLSWFDYFKDPEGTGKKDLRFEIHRFWITPQTLKKWGKIKDGKGKKVYKNINEVATETPLEVDTDREELKGYNNEDLPSNPKKTIMILERWGLYDYEGKDEGEFLTRILLANGVVISFEPHPFDYVDSPFTTFHYERNPGTTDSTGLIEANYDLSREQDRKRQQRLAIVNRLLSPFVVINENAWPNAPDLLKWKPFKTIRIKTGFTIQEACAFLVSPNLTAPSYQEEEVCVNNQNERSGINEYITGTNPHPSSRNTAYEVDTRVKMMNSRFEFIFNNLSVGIADIASKILGYERQFLSTEQSVRILGSNGFKYEKVTKKDLPEKDLDCFIIIDPTNQTEALKREQTMALIKDVLIPFEPGLEKEGKRLSRVKIVDMLSDLFSLPALNKLIEDIPAPPPAPEQQGDDGGLAEEFKQVLGLSGGGQPPALPAPQGQGMPQQNFEPLKNSQVQQGQAISREAGLS